MSYLSDITLRRGIGLFFLVLSMLLGGTWLIARVATEHLLNSDATQSARDWAGFLAANVPDLEQVAGGEQPSTSSLAFFEATRKAGQVFRYVIFNREGYSQLLSDHSRIAQVDLSTFSREAAQAAATGNTVVDVKTSSSNNRPAYFAEAFVPVIVNGRPVAVVAAFVDETENREQFRQDFLLAAAALCLLTTLSFAIPAIAWYRRTQEKQQADRRIRYLAHHDVLTGLTNRARLIERLERSFDLLPSLGTQVAVHFIDVDRFKEINDSLGHDGGDFLLKTIGERLRATIRVDDLVARLGGDEFVVIQSHVTGREQARDFANRIRAALSAPMHYLQQEIAVTVTIGVAIAPADGKTPVRALKSADLALYAGKAAGRDCVRFFIPEMDETLQTRLKLEKIIRDAVTNDGFVLHYQPIFEMNGNRLIGYEALARLPAPDGSLIPPATFIPAAEEMRLIDKVGAWVLHEACRAAATWPKELTVAINLSPTQFESGALVETVATALKEAGLEAHRLELEITETLLLRNSERTMAQLRGLKTLGASIVMDDFGTGYSSLSYLWQFPFDKIKIDRSFMHNFEISGRDVETVVKSIIALGRELRMRVTVEGVETTKQADFLYDADADQVQGFYFGLPIPASELGASMLKEFRKSHPPVVAKSGADIPLVKSAAGE